jgi:hypothetical protein
MAFSFALFEPSQTIMPKLPKSDNLEPCALIRLLDGCFSGGPMA